MEALLTPNPGLFIWTVVTFVVLLAVLTKAAWKPILQGLEQREGKIKSDLERAEQSQKEAEALRIKYETQLAQAQKTMQDLVAQARADGEKTRAKLLEDARAESDRIVQKGRQELSAETDRLKSELRQEVGGLSVQIAEKVLNRAVDKKVQEDILKESLTHIAEVKR